MSRLRRISVHVDETDPGHFFWVLLEEEDDTSQWREIESAAEPYDMWLDALLAGTKALVEYAPDQRIGPREVGGDDEDSVPAGCPLK